MSVPTLKQAPVQENTRIMGVGAYRPDVIVTNEDVCQWIDSSDEWIRQRTGIITRHRAPADVSVIDMAEGAAREALQKAGIEASQLGAVIVSTVTHPYATPSAAASLADRLGATPAPAFDISAACAGYCYGIAQGDALVRSGAANYVLVVGAEKLSDVIDNTERTISFLLGDGAGAVVIGPSDTPGIGPSVWGSDGSKWDAIGMTHSMLDVRELAADRQAQRRRSAPKKPPSPTRPCGRPCARTARPSSAGPSGRWPRWPSRPWTPPASAPRTSPPSSRTRPTCASSTRWPRSSSCPRRSRSPATSPTPATPRRPPSPWPPTACSQENPELSGGLALQIGFGAGLVFGAQVIVLP